MAAVKKPKPKTHKMKSYDSFADWKADQSSSAQSLIQALRKVVDRCDLKLTEAFKWAGGCWVNKDNLPIVYIYVQKDSVQLGFFAGSMITDPKKRLEGKGKFVRFIPIETKKDIDPTYFTSLIKKAAKIKYR